VPNPGFAKELPGGANDLTASPQNTLEVARRAALLSATTRRRRNGSIRVTSWYAACLLEPCAAPARRPRFTPAPARTHPRRRRERHHAL